MKKFLKLSFLLLFIFSAFSLAACGAGSTGTYTNSNTKKSNSYINIIDGSQAKAKNLYYEDTLYDFTTSEQTYQYAYNSQNKSFTVKYRPKGSDYDESFTGEYDGNKTITMYNNTYKKP